MSRSDLLVNLVKAGVSGDAHGVKSIAEALIADERARRHNILADRLDRALEVNGQPQKRVNGHADRHAASEFVYQIVPRRRLHDLILPDAVLRVSLQLIEEQRRASVLRAHGLDPRSRLLLIGPPGNGKTSLAEAVAEALAVPFLVVRYDALIASFLGETAARLRRVFDYARTVPCVLFFDEFDAVGKERGDVHETGEIKRVVTTLLMQMDDLPSYTIVVAATNHAELLDRATWRRFQLRLSLPNPSRNSLEQFFDQRLASVDDKPGIAAKTLVSKLGLLSYAEAEEFWFDVRRRQVLALGAQDLKSIIGEQIIFWKARSKAMSQAKTR